MKVKINYSKHFGAYNIKFTKIIDLQIAPFYGLTYYDTTNGQEIDCQFITNDYQTCDIYVYGSELCIDIRERIHKDQNINYLQNWFDSMQKAEFNLETNELEKIISLLIQNQ